MDKYIDAGAFKKRLIVKGFYPAIVARTLEEMPAADVVEVVRCVECQHSRYIGHKDCFECRKHNGCLKYPHDFCSYGERRNI